MHPPMKFTAASVKRLAPTARRYSVAHAEIPGFEIRVTPAGAKTYSITYRPEGAAKRQRYTLGRHGVITPDQATRMAREKLGLVAGGGDPQGERRAKREAARGMLTLEQFINGPLAAHYTGDPSHRDHAGTVARLLAAFRDLGSTPLDQLTRWQIDLWKRRREASPATIRRDLATLRPALSLAVTWNLIDENPCLDLRGSANRLLPRLDKGRRKRAWSEAEERAIREALRERDERRRGRRGRYNVWRAERGLRVLDACTALAYTDYLTPLVLVALGTGLRRSELFGLEWRDVDFGARVLEVRASVAKDATTRTVPMNAEVTEVLKAWGMDKRAGDLVFPGKPKRGQPGERRLTSVKTSLNGVFEAAGIRRRDDERIGLHNMRHTFATRLLDAGVGLQTVKELLGHEDVRTTAQYAHSDDEKKADAVSRLSPVTWREPHGA